MPHKARMLLKADETLLDVCLETHMSNAGSSDPLSESELNRNVEVLRVAIANWEPSIASWKRFDDAVLELCKATLAELDESHDR